MSTHLATTPFGRRTLTLAHVASQAQAKARPKEKAVHKWHVYQAICTARVRLGVSERALAVLNALLSFHPETVLSGDDLVVFPSNEQLMRRAHGMPASTLRRHLAILVDAGLVIRRDSPNGKRYARKGRDGEITCAFGFDLGPLVAREGEFVRLAEEVEAEARALKLARERITLCRRDIAKMITTGIEENVPLGASLPGGPGPVPAGEQGSAPQWHGPGAWMELHALYRSILERLPRSATLAQMRSVADELGLLADEILSILEAHANTSFLSGNESINERHIQNSKPNHPIDIEPASQESRMGDRSSNISSTHSNDAGFPLSMVMDGCPDMADYAQQDIGNWRDFLATAGLVRQALGISPTAWEEAREVMGERQAAITVACVLQRGEAISSAGGYLRDLTRRSEAGAFSVGPMLMALIKTRQRDKRRA